MASARGGQTDHLIDLLRREHFRFDSRQALRVLEIRQRKVDGADVAFRSSMSLTFPVSDIETVVVPDDAGVSPVVTVSFLGLGGATGPLPTPYTEHLNAATRRGLTAGRDFLDIFNNRLVMSAMDLAKLFSPAIQAGRPQESSLAKQFYALLGLGTPAILETIPDLAPALLPLAALINQRPLSAHAIERAVTSCFGVPARVMPFRGAWLHVSRQQRTEIGKKGRNHRLGMDAMLGGKLWDQSANITLTLGPMSLDTAERFLPGPNTPKDSVQPRLAALLNFLVDGDVGIGTQLIVDPDTVRASRLTSAQPMRLGWTSWLRGDVPTDADVKRKAQPAIALRPGVALRSRPSRA